MSLENQVVRVAQGSKDTLKALINKLGGDVTDELIDQYPDAVESLEIDISADIPITSEIPEDANIWLDPNEDAPMGGNASIAIQDEQPTDGSLIWVDTDDESGGSGGGISGSGIHVGSEEPTGDEEVWIDTDDEEGSYYSADEIDDLLENMKSEIESGMPSDFGVQMDLLWENASPTSAFAAQTISVNLTGYEFVGFECLQYCKNQKSQLPIRLYKKLLKGSFNLYYPLSGTNSTSRKVANIEDTEITFDNGLDGTTNTASTAAYCIPLRIYGIKGVS